MFVIKHKVNNTYYQKTIFPNQKHFVKYIKEARLMNKTVAKKILFRLFNKPENYEIKEVKK